MTSEIDVDINFLKIRRVHVSLETVMECTFLSVESHCHVKIAYVYACYGIHLMADLQNGI